MKRPAGSSKTKAQQKKPKPPPKDEAIDNDAEQGISDDGMDVIELGRGNFDESATSEEQDSENEAELQVTQESGSGSDDEDAMEWDGLGADGSTRANGVQTREKALSTKEIKMVHEASDLFRSNAFKLQVSLNTQPWSA